MVLSIEKKKKKENFFLSHIVNFEEYYYRSRSQIGNVSINF